MTARQIAARELESIEADMHIYRSGWHSAADWRDIAARLLGHIRWMEAEKARAVETQPADVS